MRTVIAGLVLLAVSLPVQSADPPGRAKDLFGDPLPEGATLRLGTTRLRATIQSLGILADGTLYVAGELGTDLKTRQIPDDFDEEVRNSLGTIGLILKEAGMSYSDVVSVTVYLSDMDLFAKMNAVYATYFKDPKPVRATIGVAKLAQAKAHIEISVIARK